MKTEGSFDPILFQEVSTKDAPLNSLLSQIAQDRSRLNGIAEFEGSSCEALRRLSGIMLEDLENYREIPDQAENLVKLAVRVRYLASNFSLHSFENSTAEFRSGRTIQASRDAMRFSAHVSSVVVDTVPLNDLLSICEVAEDTDKLQIVMVLLPAYLHQLKESSGDQMVAALNTQGERIFNLLESTYHPEFRSRFYTLCASIPPEVFSYHRSLIATSDFFRRAIEDLEPFWEMEFGASSDLLNDAIVIARGMVHLKGDLGVKVLHTHLFRNSLFSAACYLDMDIPLSEMEKRIVTELFRSQVCKCIESGAGSNFELVPQILQDFFSHIRLRQQEVLREFVKVASFEELKFWTEYVGQNDRERIESGEVEDPSFSFLLAPELQDAPIRELLLSAPSINEASIVIGSLHAVTEGDAGTAARLVRLAGGNYTLVERVVGIGLDIDSNEFNHHVRKSRSVHELGTTLYRIRFGKSPDEESGDSTQ